MPGKLLGRLYSVQYLLSLRRIRDETNRPMVMAGDRDGVLCARETTLFAIIADSTKDCTAMVLQGDIQMVAKTREQRFLVKVLGCIFASSVCEAFLAGDGSIEFPSERATCRKMKRGQATFLAK